jgi:hypothetical protein
MIRKSLLIFFDCILFFRLFFLNGFLVKRKQKYTIYDRFLFKWESNAIERGAKVCQRDDLFISFSFSSFFFLLLTLSFIYLCFCLGYLSHCCSCNHIVYVIRQFQLDSFDMYYLYLCANSNLRSSYYFLSIFFLS